MGRIEGYRIVMLRHTGFPDGASGKEPTCQCKRHKRQGLRSLGWEDPLEKEIATQSNFLAWEIPWTEEPGRLQSKRIGHNPSDLAHS